MRWHALFDFEPAELARLRALPTEHAIAEAAAARDGVLDHRQLSALGVSASAIGRRRERRLLYRRHRGVYAVGRADLGRRGELRAALLRCGRGAVLSHRSAAWLLDLLGLRSRIDVTTTGHGAPPGRETGIDLHYTRRWMPGEIVWVGGLPCTGVARTLADLAAGSPRRDFGPAWDNADQQLLLDVGPIGAQIARQRPGAGLLRVRLEHYDEAPPTESVLEDMFLSLCRDAGIRLPVCQWPLGTEDRSGRVDFVFFPERVALEVDGRRWHAIQAAHDRDRQRDMELREAGFDPHRYTHAQVRDHPGRVALVVRSALAARSVPGRSR